jgi:hypothetical protein
MAFRAISRPFMGAGSTIVALPSFMVVALNSSDNHEWGIHITESGEPDRLTIHISHFSGWFTLAGKVTSVSINYR